MKHLFPVLDPFVTSRLSLFGMVLTVGNLYIHWSFFTLVYSVLMVWVLGRFWNYFRNQEEER